MRKPHILTIGILVLSVAIVSILGGCESAQTSQLKVVTSTSLLTYIVQQVGGDRVSAVEIVPPTQHPGDFDATPGDIQKLAESDFFFVHGWPGETYVSVLVAAVNNPDLALVTISVEGSWMTPSGQLAATDEVAATLSEADAQNSAAYQRRANQYKARIQAKETEIKARLAEVNLTDVNAIGAFWQIGFIKWTGINVITTYNNPDSLTPRVVQKLVDEGRDAKVTLIFDNLHSGQDAGAGLAEELDCARIILTNFPGGFDNTETWEKAIDYNIGLILEAIAQ